MTTLADLLAAPAAAMVHRVPAGVTPAAIERAAVAAGWRFALVDTTGATDKAAVLAAFQDGLGLADWFGRNLDALVDALRGIADDAGAVVLWDGPEPFAAAEPDQYAAVLDILAQRAGDADRGRFLPLVRTGLSPAD